MDVHFFRTTDVWHVIAENTFCILDNAQLCHFHNPDFEVIAEQVDRCTNPNDALNMQRMLNASLPDKYLSCVRQLLNQGELSQRKSVHYSPKGMNARSKLILL